MKAFLGNAFFVNESIFLIMDTLQNLPKDDLIELCKTSFTAFRK